MIGQVRAAHPAIMLGGTDYYSALAPYLITFKYEDNCDGQKADDLSFELADRDGKFISTWMPQKGASLTASIIAERWFSPIASDLTLPCGTFWIDSVEFMLPQHNVTIKANSIPTNVRLKAGKETRGWEKTSLQDLAQQIAGENNMTLDWQAGVNPRYDRTEMHEESSLGFLMKRCADAKLSIKIKSGKIIVFDEQKLEEAAPSFSLVYGDNAVAPSGPSYRLAGAHFVTKLVDTVSKTKVSHTRVDSGEVGQGEYKAPLSEGGTSGATGAGGAGAGGPVAGAIAGAVAGTSKPAAQAPNDSGGGSADQAEERTNEDVDSEDESGEGTGGNGGSLRDDPTLAPTDWSGDAAASLKAKANARAKNKKKDQCRLELGIGNPLVAAGQTFNLVGCGQFDGKWFVESAMHTVGPEYKTELVVRRCLQGY